MEKEKKLRACVLPVIPLGFLNLREASITLEVKAADDLCQIIDLLKYNNDNYHPNP